MLLTSNMADFDFKYGTFRYQIWNICTAKLRMSLAMQILRYLHQVCGTNLRLSVIHTSFVVILNLWHVFYPLLYFLKKITKLYRYRTLIFDARGSLRRIEKSITFTIVCHLGPTRGETELTALMSIWQQLKYCLDSDISSISGNSLGKYS